jgi:actin-related protein
MKDGMIDNWDLFEKILDHTYSHYLQSESRYHPVLFSEAAVRASLFPTLEHVSRNRVWAMEPETLV